MKDFKKMPKMACGGKVKKYADGGEAYVGTKLNLPVKTRLGKVSSSDARLLNKQDASPEGQKAKFERRHAIPSSATAEERSGATPGTEELQYIKRGGRIAKKVGKVKKYADGGAAERNANIVGGIREALRSGKDLDPGVTTGRMPKYDLDPGVKRPSSGKINIPGIGEYKEPHPKVTPSGAMLLKKGGKAKKNK
jgi:hypothetical protein